MIYSLAATVCFLIAAGGDDTVEAIIISVDPLDAEKTVTPASTAPRRIIGRAETPKPMVIAPQTAAPKASGPATTIQVIGEGVVVEGKICTSCSTQKERIRRQLIRSKAPAQCDCVTEESRSARSSNRLTKAQKPGFMAYVRGMLGVKERPKQRPAPTIAQVRQGPKPIAGQIIVPREEGPASTPIAAFPAPTVAPQSVPTPRIQPEPVARTIPSPPQKDSVSTIGSIEIKKASAETPIEQGAKKPEANHPADRIPIAVAEVKRSSAAPATSEDVSKTMEPCHAEDYRWVQGRLQRVHLRGGHWVVRYAPLDQTDRHGGSFVLVRDSRLNDYKEGDLVRIHGEILNDKSSSFLGGPLYRALKVELVESASATR